MFRRLRGSLPQDPEFPANLEKLGYFLDEKSRIRMIKNPDKNFQFFITNNDRYNELNREAMHVCVMREISRAMTELGIPKLYLPQLTTIKPKAPHVPIYATAKDKLVSKDRVVVVVGGQPQEFGCWSFRILFDDGIEGTGSSVGLAKELSRHNDPGLIVLNPSQLLYSHSMNRAMSWASWRDRPRESAAHPQHLVDKVENHVPGNKTVDQHLQHAFDRIINNAELVSPNAKVEIIGILEGANDVLTFLNANWPSYSDRVSAIALINPWEPTSSINSPRFAEFLRDRARSWVLSSAPRNTPLAVPHLPKRHGKFMEHFHCPTFSGGIDDFPECIFPTSYKDILEWLDEVNKDPEGYRNPTITPVEWDEEVLQPPEQEGSGSCSGEKAENSVGQEFQEESRATIAGVDVSKSALDKAGLA